MMFLLQLLLFLFMREGVSGQTVKIKVPHCGVSMKCLGPDVCMSPAATRKKLDEIQSYSEIHDDCPALVKLRVFSQQKWLITLESYKSTVDKITLEQGNTKFECLTVDSKAKAMYNTEEKEPLYSSTSPLVCTFLIEIPDPGEVLPNSPKDAILSVEGKQFKLVPGAFILLTTPSCNPANAKLEKEGSIGAKMAVRVEEASHSTDLICRSKFTLVFKDTNKERFEEVSTIKCTTEGAIEGYSVTKKDQSSVFFAKTFDAHCERSKCEMCADKPPKSPCAKESKLKVTENDDGCKKLMCISGRIKLESSRKLYKEAECVHKNDRHVYAIGEEVITNESDIQCMEKAECDEAQALEICSTCIIDKLNQPRCSTGSILTVTEGEREVAIQSVVCNGESGNFEVQYTTDKVRPMTTFDRFKCTFPPPKIDESKKFTEAHLDEFAEAKLGPWKITVGILCAIIVLLIVIFVNCAFKKSKQNKQAKTQLEGLNNIKVEPSKETNKLSEPKISKKEENSNPIEANKANEANKSSPTGTPGTGTGSGSLMRPPIAESVVV